MRTKQFPYKECQPEGTFMKKNTINMEKDEPEIVWWFIAFALLFKYYINNNKPF